MLHLVTCLPTYRILAITNPKKKDQTKIEWLDSNQVITLASDKILIATPENKATKKERL